MIRLKQIQYALYFLLAGYWLTACMEADIDSQQPDGEQSPIRFDMPHLGTNLVSRAESILETLPEGTTMRVIAYRRSTEASDTEVDFSSATPEAELTCRVASDGNLVPWVLDDRGVATGTQGSGEVMYLRKGTYDFYAVSPGYKPEKNGTWAVSGIPHRTDVMTSCRMGIAVDGKNEKAVSLKVFTRQCAQIVFEVRPEEKADDIGHLKGTSLGLAYLSTAPGTLPVKRDGVIPPSCAARSDDPAGQLKFAASEFEELEPASPTRNKVKAIVLPKSESNAGVQISVILERNEEIATLSAQLDKMAFEAGKKYFFMLTVGSGSTGTLELQVTNWLSNRYYDDQVGTPDKPGTDPGPGGDDIEWGKGTVISVAKWNDIVWTDNNVGGGGSLEKPSILLNAESGSAGTFDITETNSWNFYKAMWFNVTGTNISTNGNSVSGSGAVKATVTTLSANPSAEARSYTIMLPGITVPVVQAGATLTRVYPTGTVTVGAAANSSSTSATNFQGTAGLYLGHTLSAGCDWLSVGAYPNISTTGTMAFTTVASRLNSSSSSRSATVTMRAGNTAAPFGPSVDFPVSQAGAVLSVTNASVPATASSNNTATIAGTSGMSWQVASDEAWLSTSSSGTFSTGNSSVKFNVTGVNPNETSRTGTLTVKAGDGISKGDAGLVKKVNVTQGASSLSVSASNTSFPNTGGSGTLTINGTTGLAYTVSAVAWIEMAGTLSGIIDGSKTCSFGTTKVNPSANTRQGAVSVKAGNITKTVTITQAASLFSVNKTSLSIPAEGGSASVQITATTGLKWTVEKVDGAGNNNTAIVPDSWNGEGSKTILFSAPKNWGDYSSAVFQVYVDEERSRYSSISVGQVASPLPSGSVVGNIQVASASSEYEAKYIPHSCYGETTYCKGQIDGFSNWRLPSKMEMGEIYKSSGLSSTYKLIYGKTYWVNDGYKAQIYTNQWEFGWEWFIPDVTNTSRWMRTNDSCGNDLGEGTPFTVRCVRDI